MRTTHLLVILTLSILTACAGTQSLSTNPADMRGDWELTSIGGNEVQAGGEAAYTLSFNADSTVAGRASCNYYAARYTAMEEGGALNIESFSATEINCDSGSEHSTFINSIQNAESFQVEEGNRLVLSSGGDEQIVFTKAASPEEGDGG